MKHILLSFSVLVGILSSSHASEAAGPDLSRSILVGQFRQLGHGKVLVLNPRIRWNGKLYPLIADHVDINAAAKGVVTNADAGLASGVCSNLNHSVPFSGGENYFLYTLNAVTTVADQESRFGIELDPNGMVESVRGPMDKVPGSLYIILKSVICSLSRN